MLVKLLEPMFPPHTFLLATKFIVGVEVTVIVIAALVIAVGLAHAALDVMVHVISCPFVNAALEYPMLSTPTFTPFTFH